ncbi:MAG: DUF3530 family protein [Gammaproteobacteria bacterium]|nr:DUF3530 family protein [Gammaproteobacteria bacterium]
MTAPLPLLLIKSSSIFLILLLSSQVSYASDWLRERRMAEEIVDIIFDGEAVSLPGAEREFLGIYTESEASNKAVLVIHGRGFHPDWADTVQPLRIGLVEYGWNTLSIQMPVLAKHARYYDYVEIFDEAIPRITTALEYLQENGNEHIAIVAHSCGAHMMMHYLKQYDDDDFIAFVGIGMGATDYKQPMREPFPLDSLSVPILDIYGADDYPAVHRLAPGRSQQIQQAGHTLSQQTVVADADHYFTDRGEELVEVVGQWLDDLEIQ